jgi:hypothetical protein
VIATTGISSRASAIRVLSARGTYGMAEAYYS